MQVVPVIDLQRGLAVHGRSGDRATYRPVQTVLASHPDPMALALGCRTQLGLHEIYLADLDAIAGHDPRWDLYAELIDAGSHLWLDAGTGRVDQVMEVCDRLGNSFDLVLGLETLVDSAVAEVSLSRLGPNRTVVSLDLDDGMPRTIVPAWRELEATAIARRLIELGVRRLILLDIRRVGSGQGTGTTELLQRLRDEDCELHITCGGGIRDFDDARRLAEAGCDALLLATTLHDGRIGRSHVRQLSEMSRKC